MLATTRKATIAMADSAPQQQLQALVPTAATTDAAKPKKEKTTLELYKQSFREYLVRTCITPRASPPPISLHSFTEHALVIRCNGSTERDECCR